HQIQHGDVLSGGEGGGGLAGGGEGLGAGLGPGDGAGGGAGGAGGGGGGAVRWAAASRPTTTIRCDFWCLGWQANSVTVASGVGLAIQAASGVTMNDSVTV